MSDDMEQLKVVKKTFHGGRPHLAYLLAKAMFNGASEHTKAMLEHRMAMTAAASGLLKTAMLLFARSETRFQHLEKPDWMGHAMLRRDRILFELTHCALAHGKERDVFELDCFAAIQESYRWLEALPDSKRVLLEKRVSRAFVTRMQLLQKPYDLALIAQLEHDWREIRELRGLTKAIYELDALECLVNASFSDSPVVPDERIRRAIVLSVVVGDVRRIARYTLKPGINAFYGMGARMMKQFD